MDIRVKRKGRRKDLTLCIGERIEIDWDRPKRYHYFGDWLFQCESHDGGTEFPQRELNFKFLCILGLGIAIYKDMNNEKTI